MKDQNAIVDNETKQQKWNRGLDLFIESVLKPVSYTHLTLPTTPYV